MKIQRFVIALLATFAAWTNVPIATAQANAIDPEFKKYLLHSVDRRSMPEALLNLAGLTSQDVGRSFALIVGVSRYPKMQPPFIYLAPVDRDVDLLFAYLKNQQFFDEIVVLRDAAVSFDSLRYFLETYFPERLKRYPKSRFLFAYSGHGMTEGDSGYLLTSDAKNLIDKQHSIDMFALRGFSRQTIEVAYHSLFLINACHSGAFGGKSREGVWDVLLKRPGAHAIMSSGAADASFGEADNGSFFYQKLIDGLNGAADPTGKGVITVADLGVYLQIQVGLATGGKQVPTWPQDIWSGVSDGGMFFFNRQKAVKIADLPVWDPRGVLQLGADDKVVARTPPPLPSTIRETPVSKPETSSVSSHTQAADHSGNIIGQVTDPSGNAIANAEVTLSDPTNGWSAKTVSDGVGAYRFDDVPPGKYSLVVRAGGYGEVTKSVDSRLAPVLLPVPVSLSLKVASVSTSTGRNVYLPTYRGFGPLPTGTRGTFRTYVQLPIGAPVEVTTRDGRLYFSDPALGSISCEGLSVSSESVRAVDASGALIPNVDRISIKSSSGSITFYGLKENREARDALRATLESLCSNPR